MKDQIGRIISKSRPFSLIVCYILHAVCYHPTIPLTRPHTHPAK